MSKPLSEVPKEKLERWKELSTRKPPKRRKVKLPHVPSVPSTSKLPSLHLLLAETERLRNAETLEERREIQQRIRGLHDKVMDEGADMREQSMRRSEELRRGRMMRTMAPIMFEAEKRYECPKCHRKWRSNELNYSVRGKGKRKKKIPWCLYCNLQIFPEDSPALKHTIIPLKGKYPKNLTLTEAGCP